MQWQNGDYIIDDNKDNIDIEKAYNLLSKTYWAAERTREQVRASIQNSLCFGLYTNGGQVGFARAVTDEVTFTWLCDVVIDQAHRGKGLGKWLVQFITEHPKIFGTRMFLMTRDAHGLYEKFGFIRAEAMTRRVL